MSLHVSGLNAENKENKLAGPYFCFRKSSTLYPEAVPVTQAAFFILYNVQHYLKPMLQLISFISR